MTQSPDSCLQRATVFTADTVITLHRRSKRCQKTPDRATYLTQERHRQQCTKSWNEVGGHGVLKVRACGNKRCQVNSSIIPSNAGYKASVLSGQPPRYTAPHTQRATWYVPPCTGDWRCRTSASESCTTDRKEANVAPTRRWPIPNTCGCAALRVKNGELPDKHLRQRTHIKYFAEKRG